MISQEVQSTYTTANPNFFCASIIVETLIRSGLSEAIISPGSRSAPLTTCFALNPKVATTTILDERSAAFFALGRAKATHKPVALICSSGTAAANYFPAVIEARLSKVPLIILTADRPPEMRACHSGQTIDQVKLYGDYVNFYKELALPEASNEVFEYFRQTMQHAYNCSSNGPVHLNVPFRDPLAPLEDPLFRDFIKDFDYETFFKNSRPPTTSSPSLSNASEIIDELHSHENGLIVVGTVAPENIETFVQSVAHISQSLNWPILAEGLSPLRNYSDKLPNLISTYDTIVRSSEVVSTLVPSVIIQIGALPTSKPLRAFLKSTSPTTYLIDTSGDNLNPLHTPSHTLNTTIENFAKDFTSSPRDTNYLKTWLSLDKEVSAQLTQALNAQDNLFEGKLAFLLSKHLPKETPLFIASSMPVRDVEYFWQKNSLNHVPHFNRGANGIDGTLSTALGIAHKNKPAVLVTGDLSLLHDTNGFLINKDFEGSLTIVLINNNGGGIFQNLPIAQFDAVFEEHFITPQNISFKQLAETYQVSYTNPSTWEELLPLIRSLTSSGIQIIELTTNRNSDVPYRKHLFKSISDNLSI